MIYSIGLTMRNIYRLFPLSFKVGESYPTRNSFEKYYVTLVVIKNFNALMENQPFFGHPVKSKQETYKNLKCQETMIIKHEIY